MSLWHVLQVCGILGLVFTICFQIVREINMNDLPHGHNETQSGPGYAMGRDAVQMSIGAGSSSGPPPTGNREIHNRICRDSWNVAPNYNNTEMILWRQRFRVPA